MARPLYPPGAPMGAYPADVSGVQSYNPPSYPPYSILLGPGQLPESVAYWHNTIQQPGMAPLSGSHSLQNQSAQGPPDQKKHKRTRSGCFTCRSRRVKCDEARPVCDRCQKGKRDCIYPPLSAKLGSRVHSKSRQSAQDSGSSDENDTGGLEPILDEEESPEPSTVAYSAVDTTKAGSGLSKRQSMPSLGKRRGREASDASSASKTNSESASLGSASKSYSESPPGNQYRQNIATLLEFSRLPNDIRFCLSHHQEKLSYHHYFLSEDSDGFIHDNIIELALKYEPLLYAIVGFSAYHHTLRQPDGKLYDFLKYYNKSLTLLRKSLGSREQYGEATLITILQLATFEECIGDWVNLIDHHQAAHFLMGELFTPQSIVTNELHRHIFFWYARFDVVAGLLGGNEAILSRKWYKALEEHNANQATSHPNNAQMQLALVRSQLLTFALDMASLFAKLSRGMIAMDQFLNQHEHLSQTLEDMCRVLQTFDHSEHAVTSNLYVQPSGPDDVLDPYIPRLLYTGPLWSANFLWVDVLATELLFKYQSHLLLQRPDGPELQRQALEVCHRVETIIRCPKEEVGVGKAIAFHTALPITGLFLPRDHKHIMWSRRKLALMEQNGYLYAPKIRAGIADVWQIPEVNDWWLPDDQGCPDIVKEIRTLTEERTANPRDNLHKDIRDIKNFFQKITINDASNQSPPSIDSEPLTEPSPDQGASA